MSHYRWVQPANVPAPWRSWLPRARSSLSSNRMRRAVMRRAACALDATARFRTRLVRVCTGTRSSLSVCVQGSRIEWLAARSVGANSEGENGFFAENGVFARTRWTPLKTLKAASAA